MRDYRADQRVVMTLDAGGTNFVFSAMRRGDRRACASVCLCRFAVTLFGADRSRISGGESSVTGGTRGN